jgi:hypothetical protein
MVTPLFFIESFIISNGVKGIVRKALSCSSGQCCGCVSSPGCTNVDLLPSCPDHPAIAGHPFSCCPANLYIQDLSIINYYGIQQARGKNEPTGVCPARAQKNREQKAERIRRQDPDRLTGRFQNEHNRMIDAMLHAMHPGKRRSASGHTYYERRENRADRSYATGL